MHASTAGLSFDVDRGPDWIFVRVSPPEDTAVETPQLAAAVWALLEQNFVYRVVLELDRIQLLRSYMVGQLIMLAKRVHSHGGVLRICGLSDVNEEVLRCCQLAGQLPNYRDRGDAVMCSRPSQPR
jgi:anti-anti-sigma regulatory factor